MRNKEIKETVYKNVYQNASEGYVLTPSELAFEMVSTLPNDVFESESTTFLDPICKSGTFLFEIVEKLYNQGHSIGNIEKRIYTIDSNSHSLNIANSYIKKILNKESGSFGVDFKSDFSESFFNYAVNVVSKGRFKTFDEFIYTILIDKKMSYLMVKLKRNISEFIERYEKVSKLESKLFGEVFTPRQLIDEMLDTLPAEVWKNKDLKWLDPAVGIGNFPAAILDRLMVGLEDSIPNEDNRRKWILEEMLYMCDISIKNLFLLYKLFDENNEFKLNVYRGSFLTEDFDKCMKEVWGLEGFDVVVGNPPYQDPNKPRHKFWTKFLKKSLDISTYTCFVTPKSASLLLNGLEVDHLKLETNIICYNGYDVNNYFNVGSDFSSYLLSNNVKLKHKLIKTENGYEEWDNEMFIPYNPNKIVSSIIGKTLSFENEWNRKVSRVSEDENGEFRVINSIKTNDIVWKKSKNSHTDTFKYKMLYATLGEKYFLDYNANIMPSTSFVPYIVVENKLDLDLLPMVSKTKIFKFLTTQFSSMRSPIDFVWKSIKKTFIINDQELYEHFNLTQEEINLIEKTIKDK
jgi:hypothetical protein